MKEFCSSWLLQHNSDTQYSKYCQYYPITTLASIIPQDQNRISDTIVKKPTRYILQLNRYIHKVQKKVDEKNRSGDIKTSKFSRDRQSEGIPLCASSEWKSSRQEPTPARKSDTTTLTTISNSNYNRNIFTERSKFIKSAADIVSFTQECY